MQPDRDPEALRGETPLPGPELRALSQLRLAEGSSWAAPGGDCAAFRSAPERAPGMDETQKAQKSRPPPKKAEIASVPRLSRDAGLAFIAVLRGKGTL